MLLQDAMDAIESIDAIDMRKVFRFEFIGEPALDAGGVAREFYSIICEQLFNPDCGLFLYSGWYSVVSYSSHYSLSTSSRFISLTVCTLIY